MNNIIKVMSPVKAYYTVVYWSTILSLPLYYILLRLYIGLWTWTGVDLSNLLDMSACIFFMYKDNITSSQLKQKLM